MSTDSSVHSSGIPDWTELYSATDQRTTWDHCTLGGVDFPGITKVKITKLLKVDKKSAPGFHGATLTFQGYEPADITITNVIYDTGDFDALVTAIQTLEPKPTKKSPLPVDLFHPLAFIRRVQSVVVQSVDGPNQTQPGRWETVFKCLEYFPPKGGATTTPQTSLAPRQSALIQPVQPVAPSGSITPKLT